MNKKRIIIGITSVVFVVLIAGVVAFTLHKTVGSRADTKTTTPPTQTNTTSSDQITIPPTTKEQNEAGDTAFAAARAAISKGDKTEAKKQLDIAKALYTAASNQDGLNNVMGTYPVVNAIQERSTTPKAS